jgi:hypothetical protein
VVVTETQILFNGQNIVPIKLMVAPELIVVPSVLPSLVLKVVPRTPARPPLTLNSLQEDVLQLPRKRLLVLSV